jgi:Na+/H+ antiporter NhaD/arsenite permease-like protein
MSFEMERLPSATEEKRSHYRWMFAYCSLFFAFSITGFVLLIDHEITLGLFSLFVSFICNGLTQREYEAYRRCQEFENE